MKACITGMARGFSVVKLVVFVFVGVLLLTIATYTYFCWQPQDLTHVNGRDEILQQNIPTNTRSLLTKIHHTAHTHSRLQLHEKEINFYIANKLKLNQAGEFKQWAKIKGVYVNLTPDHAEIIIERELAHYDEQGIMLEDSFDPKSHTLSLTVKYTITEKNGKKNINIEFPAARLGKAPAPGAYVRLVKPTFDTLAQFFKAEINAILPSEWPGTIKIHDGYLELDADPNVKL